MLSLDRPASSRPGGPLPLAAEHEKSARRGRGRFLLSGETAACFGEGVGVGGDGLVDAIVRGLIVIFAFELPVEPTRQIAQRLDYRLFRIEGHVLSGRPITSLHIGMR